MEKEIVLPKREIKFRALYRGNWYQVQELIMFADGSRSIGSLIGLYGTPDNEHIKAIVQFSGKLDCNGKEIYEGHICKYLLDEEPFDEFESGFVLRKGYVGFGDHGFQFYGEKYEPTVNNYCIREIEILGDIYLNNDKL